jgi:beta-exotoxin I transport system ATP-binding protein
VSAAIETVGLTKTYGETRAVVDLGLRVEQGEVFGFLGPNGAGKTTTIRMLLALQRPTAGRSTVLGLDSQRDGVEAHRRIGYLPGELELYPRMTGRRHIDWFARARGLRDLSAARELTERFAVVLDRPAKELSKGNRQKIGLVLAFMHRPDLLILDEPTAGLDPLVQQSFNELLFEAKADGRTVFLSSHIISEVERTCDRVAIIREGRLVRVDTVEGVRALAAHEVELRFAAPVAAAAFEAIDGVTNVVEEGRTLRMLVTGPIAPVVRLAGQHELVDFVSREPSLEEVFLSEYASESTTTSARAGAAS